MFCCQSKPEHATLLGNLSEGLEEHHFYTKARNALQTSMGALNCSKNRFGSSFLCFFMSRVFLPAVLVTCVFSRIPFWKRLIAPLSFRPYEPDNPTFDPLTATVFELQELLSSKKINSVDLVSQYITQIKLHDEYLKAVLCIAPTAIEEAHRLDRERLDGRIRGPLHGIPILVKVSSTPLTFIHPMSRALYLT